MTTPNYSPSPHSHKIQVHNIAASGADEIAELATLLRNRLLFGEDLKAALTCLFAQLQ